MSMELEARRVNRKGAYLIWPPEPPFLVSPERQPGP